MRVKELVDLYRGSYGIVEINYNNEQYDEATHGGMLVRYFYSDHELTIHDGIVIIKDKLVVITEQGII